MRPGTRVSPRRSSRRAGAPSRRRDATPRRRVTTASRERSRTASRRRRRGRLPCHAGAASRSFSRATSRRRRSRGVPCRRLRARREDRQVLPLAPSRRGRRGRGSRARAWLDPTRSTTPRPGKDCEELLAHVRDGDDPRPVGADEHPLVGGGHADEEPASVRRPRRPRSSPPKLSSVRPPSVTRLPSFETWSSANTVRPRAVGDRCDIRRLRTRERRASIRVEDRHTALLQHEELLSVLRELERSHPLRRRPRPDQPALGEQRAPSTAGRTSAKPRTKPGPASHAGANPGFAAASPAGMSCVPSPATTCRRPSLMYAIRVSVACRSSEGSRHPAARASSGRALGVERGELVRPCRDDVAAERGPRRLVVGPEQPPRAVRLGDPDALSEVTSSRPGAGSEERRLRVFDADRARTRSIKARPGGLSTAARSATATAAAATSGQRGGGEPAAARRRPATTRRPAPPPPRRPGSRCRSSSALIGHLRIASRPRRSRELTVPRGRLSIAAISPGV